jgi:D-alanyl-D-alanine carboxypeptidase
MMKLRFLLAIACLFAFQSNPLAQGVPPALEAAFNLTLKAQRNALGVKSLSAAVQLSNDSVWAGAYGISSTFPQDSVTPEHAYAIGSITKTITAACILQLADEGVLQLDDSLHEWLPSFPFVDSNITIRQLLRHQSGLYDVITNPAYDAATKINLDSVWSLYNLVNDYINPPLFAPGTGWSYSNTNYALLGMIVEAATGNSYRTEYTNRFFAPLQLNDLVLSPYDGLPDDIAHLWTYNPANGSSADAHYFFSNWNSFFTSAGPIGGYFGTARDIAVWNRAFLRGDLHSPAILAEAKTSVPTPNPANGRYGLGIMQRKFLNWEAFGHGGDIGYSSITYYFPEKDISITVLNNDQKKNSWALAPVVQALLKNYLDYQASVATQSPLGIEALNASVYPNPFHDAVLVSVNLPADVQDVQVILTDAAGRELTQHKAGYRAAGSQQFTLDQLQNLPSGAYFIQIVLDGSTVKTLKTMR